MNKDNKPLYSEEHKAFEGDWTIHITPWKRVNSLIEWIILFLIPPKLSDDNYENERSN